MLIVLSLCESKPSHLPARCHVGTQWCIYSVQIHGRALTCFIVLYVDLHHLCRRAAGRAATKIQFLTFYSRFNFLPFDHLLKTLETYLRFDCRVAVWYVIHFFCYLPSVSTPKKVNFSRAILMYYCYAYILIQVCSGSVVCGHREAICE